MDQKKNIVRDRGSFYLSYPVKWQEQLQQSNISAVQQRASNLASKRNQRDQDWYGRSRRMRQDPEEYRKSQKKSFFRPNDPISMPSISIDPAYNSTIPSKAAITVDLPAPFLPTTPTLLLAGMDIFGPFRTSGKPGLFPQVGRKTHCPLIAARASNVSTWET